MEYKSRGGQKRDWEKEKLAYGVGPLMYTPAIQESAAEGVIERKYGGSYSLCFCLEDSIRDEAVGQAEKQLEKTLGEICEAWRAGQIKNEELPLIFVRVRTPGQLEQLGGKFLAYSDILAGYVFPKFSVSGGRDYIGIMKRLNEKNGRKMYMMPILESGDIIDMRTRKKNLYAVKDMLDEAGDMVLNVRVGGNDFCSYFGVRRRMDESIYDVRAVSKILTDILTVFSRDYVVSGPVWEYFAGDRELWKKGLEREIRMDLLNGFIGKTVIHPNQIPVVNSCMRVRKADYQDALSILDWEGDSLGVAKNNGGERMNEKKTHTTWAKKVLKLAEIYGVNDDENI
ncbi:HpcH/HpaI aldolase/citrate lyase family protein [Clostridium sp. AM58-1XD]|uniref:HpcH/HpaI aldolase/citrate lyase family protein n=1 Tax=Clostridium sp. AM58-1XD TaxID=2292307 RepID=UPI000E4B7F36|nr:HpcH/HpaI aldolase/citrate lyase family protein [Clostridium sp. AM58-1XD]RGY96572.1 hypothetical protein DXA13_16965 [Clostridium sp. AM58-1XD]